MPAPSPSLLERNLWAAIGLLLQLQRRGLRHLVLAPGSRSAPLAVAAALLEAEGLLLVHPCIDERSGAFLALGLGRALGLPAAVITTSGSAVANLLPAAVEADHGTVPLLLLTADRPARLKGCGANQAVNQEQFLVGSCRWSTQAPPQGLSELPAPALRALADQAWAATLQSPLGPVHLNLPFEEPLHADGALVASLRQRLQADLQDQAKGPMLEPLQLASLHLAEPSAPGVSALRLDPSRTGLIVAGPWRGRSQDWESWRSSLHRWQQRSGWPVLADPLSGLRGDPSLTLIQGYDLLLESTALPAPEQVLRLGPLPASRRLQRWLERFEGPQVLVTEAEPRPLDPLQRVRAQSSAGLVAWVAALEACPPAPAAASLSLLGGWQQAEALVQEQLGAWCDQQQELSEPLLAHRLSRLLPAGLPLMLANSSPVRDWESFADHQGPARPLIGFRGASGIDGTLSEACGLAIAYGEAVLISGDLALLHDSNGWLWRSQLERQRARLTVLLIDNGGGGIFEQLPIRPEPAEVFDFERLFAMGQAVDPLALAAAHGVPGRELQVVSDLEPALTWALRQPLALLRLVTDRRADARRRLQLRAQVLERLARGLHNGGQR